MSKGQKNRDQMRRNAFAPPSRQERLKYEVAEELGLLPKVLDVGWPGLTTAESGRVGGVVARKLREEAARQQAGNGPETV